MNRNIMAGWIGYLTLLGCVVLAAIGLTAAGFEYWNWAIAAGAGFLASAAIGIATLAIVIHIDHKLGDDVPHPFSA